MTFHLDPGTLRATRRGFLRLASSTAALATLSQVRALPAAAADAAPAARFFAARETEILTQVVERMVATGEPGAPPVRETRAVETIDRLLGSLDPGTTAPLPALLRLIDWGPPLFEARFARFTSLGPDAQDASLRGWMTSRFAIRRLAFTALRNISFLGYWSQEETWPLIGYAGPLLRRGKAVES